MPEEHAEKAPADQTPAQKDPSQHVDRSDEKGPDEKVDKVEKAFNASQMAMRQTREMLDTVKALREEVSSWKEQQSKAKAKMPAELPAGLEDRMKDLESKLQASESARAKEKLDSTILHAASKKGVDPRRIDYLTYKLKQQHGDTLTHEGIPDAFADGKHTSVDALIEGLLGTDEGAVFKAAPQTAKLPVADSSAQSSTDKLPEFSKADLEAGRIPPAIRKTGLYRIKEESR